MIQNKNWIEKAKQFFADHGGKSYSDEDAKTARDINLQFREYIEKMLSEVDRRNELKLHKQGSKWNKQGQTVLLTFLKVKPYTLYN